MHWRRKLYLVWIAQQWYSTAVKTAPLWNSLIWGPNPLQRGSSALLHQGVLPWDIFSSSDIYNLCARKFCVNFLESIIFWVLGTPEVFRNEPSYPSPAIINNNGKINTLFSLLNRRIGKENKVNIYYPSFLSFLV